MYTLKKTGSLVLMALLIIALGSCGNKNNKSRTTGWNYNDPENGGFEVTKYVEQEAGPGLVLIEGGIFAILILFFFITLMEATIYMARVAFKVDKLMYKIGLHGT